LGHDQKYRQLVAHIPDEYHVFETTHQITESGGAFTARVGPVEYYRMDLFLPLGARTGAGRSSRSALHRGWQASLTVAAPGIAHVALATILVLALARATPAFGRAEALPDAFPATADGRATAVVADPLERAAPAARPDNRHPLRMDDHIVSMAGILLDARGLNEAVFQIQVLHLILDPGRKSHREAEALHGYSDWLLRHQQLFAEFARTISELIDKADLIVAHNAEFDIGFLNTEFRWIGLPPIEKPVYCTMQQFRETHPSMSSRLDNVARLSLGVARRSRTHGALEDAWLAMLIYLRLHDCPYFCPLDSLGQLRPVNLREAPPLPEGKLPPRKRRPRRPIE
jgi:DNA polymerase III subunit epsilon